MTPPLAMFVKQVKMNPFNPSLKPVITSEMEVHRKSIIWTLIDKKWENTENIFWNKFNLSKPHIRREKLNFIDYENKIQNSDFSDKEDLQDFLS
jgi:hypothetical protein